MNLCYDKSLKYYCLRNQKGLKLITTLKIFKYLEINFTEKKS